MPRVLVQYIPHVLYELVTFLFYNQCTFFQLEIRYWVCAPNITSLGKVTGYVSESIEWFIECQAFLRTYYSAPRPPPNLPSPFPVSKLPLRLNLPVCRRSSLLTREKEGVGVESNHTTTRKLGPLYIVQYSLVYLLSFFIYPKIKEWEIDHLFKFLSGCRSYLSSTSGRKTD